MAELNNLNCTTPKLTKMKQIKIILPQIIVTMAVSSLTIILGIGTVYSAVLIPQLMDAENSTDANTIIITTSEGTWITSCVGLVMPFSSLIAGILMDRYGRTNVLKLSAIPHIMGWGMIALATNKWMLICGRIITAIAATWAGIPAFVYIAEIASPDIRGALLSLISPAYALGMLITYLKGWVLHWRIIAWITVGYTVVTFIMIIFIPESPSWLISKNKLEEAKKSMQWFNKYQPDYTVEKFETMVLESYQEKKGSSTAYFVIVDKAKQFLQPTVYKPFVLLLILLLIQQFSGTHIILMNAVIFFDNIGTKFDPYLASTYMATMKLCYAIMAIWLMKQFNRRTLLMVSCVGMAMCMITSGLYTKWIQEDKNTTNWIPLCMLILYFLFIGGAMSVPLAITPELFPLSVRGLASSLIIAITSFMMFGALQSYNPLHNLLGGISGVQFFFGCISALGFVFVYLVLPETHNKHLSDMQLYFEKNTIYISSKCTRKRADDGSIE